MTERERRQKLVEIATQIISDFFDESLPVEAIKKVAIEDVEEV